jgi:hypothetical protein
MSALLALAFAHLLLRQTDCIRGRHNHHGRIRRRNHAGGAGVLCAELLAVARRGRAAPGQRRKRELRYLRANYLARRWNLDDAQANVFAWGGVGSASGNDFRGNRVDREAGFQADYETRRLYASWVSDLHESSAYSHRVDTLQLGFAPYAHDYTDLAMWFVARQYTASDNGGR